MTAPLPTEPQITPTEPSLTQALWRGWRRKCPHCGSGPILKNYLKVRDNCTVCREDLTHQRTDDGPAYFTILIVGHLMAPIMLSVYFAYRPEPLVTITIFTIGCVLLSLYLLPRLKGMLLAFQWARGMHGFADRDG